MNKLIYLTITAVCFPVYIRFSGRDALTTGSICIIVIFGIYVLKYLLDPRGSKKFAIFLTVLSIISVISTFSVPAELLGKSFRHFVAFLCSMLLFFTIANYLFCLDDQERGYAINNLITFIVVMMAVQIIIGMIVYYYPPFGKIFSLFTTRDKDILATEVEVYKRLSCIVAGGEGFGEIIAVLAPLVFYLMVKHEGSLFPVVLCVLYTFGVLLSATRSSIVLFCLAALIFLIFNIKQINASRLLLLSYIFFIALIVVIYGFPKLVGTLGQVWDIILSRFHIFSETYTKTQSLNAAVNRKGVWDYAFFTVISNINAFGNGMFTPGNFHNLYLTLFYQFGIVGAIIFIVFFISLLVRLTLSYWHTVDRTKKTLILSCIISLVVLLVNEIKFEFTRHSSYQQIIWTLFAVYWVASLDKTSYKNYLR